MVHDLVDDIRFCGRLLRKQPTFTIAAIVMLALGIGVNATVFSWLDTVVLNPLPGVSDASTLVSVVQSDRAAESLPLMSYPDFAALGDAGDVVSGVVGARGITALLEHDGRTDWVSAAVATANVLDVLGVRPELGRGFERDEDVGEGQHAVLMLGDRLWRRDFGADPSIVGRTVRLNHNDFIVVGIVPATFHGITGGSQVDVWAPLTMHEAVLNYGSYSSRTFRWIHALARLRPGASVAAAQAALAVRSARLAAAYPDSNAGVEYKVFPLWKSPDGGQAAFLPVLRIVFVTAAGVLLIVIANLACLLLSRGTRRQTEILIRVAIGAGRSRLVRQFLAESLTLAAAGGAAGLLVAGWSVRLLPRLIPSVADAAVYEFALSGRVVVFTAGLALVSAVLFGLVPAFVASGLDLTSPLRGGARGATGAVQHHRILSALVVAELAVALALLVGAGLCVRGFREAARVDLGFEPDRVLYAGFNLVPNGYTAERAKVFDRALRQRVRSLPGIVDAAFVNTAPLGTLRPFTGVLDVEGREARASEDRTMPFVIASPGYLSVMRIPLLAGRDFEEADDETRARVAIVNDTMVRRYWPGVNPIGRRFRMAVGIAPSDTFVVVGVCGTSKYGSLAEPPTPMVYVTYLQRPIASLFMNLVVRTAATADAAGADVRREIHALDPAVEPLGLMTMDRYIQPAFMPIRIAATLVTTVATAALLLAAIGLYAVMSYVVAERTKELGIRIALGASVADTARLVMTHALALIATGIVAGQALAFTTTRLLARFLYGISATDAATFVAITIVLTAVAVVACAVPVWRVAHTDPVAAMRSD